MPSSHDVRDERPLARSLRYAAAHTIGRPDDLFILGVRPPTRDLDLPGIVAGPDDGRGTCEVAQLVVKASDAPPHAEVEGRLLWNTGILAGAAWTLLRLIERRVPDIIMEAQAAIRGANVAVTAELNARLRGLDFHRDVLPGNERYLRVLSIPRFGSTEIDGSECSGVRMLRA